MILRSVFLFCLIWINLGSNLSFYRSNSAWAVSSDRELSPNLNSSAVYDLGLQQFENRQYQEAIATFLRLIETEPNNPQAYNMLGMSWGELEEYSAAITSFDRAIALDNKFANAYYNRGYIHKQLGRPNLALTNFNRAIELTADNHISALIERSSIYARRSSYQLALKDLDRVVKLKPELATAYYNRALVYLAFGNRAAYLDDLEIAEKIYLLTGDRAGLGQVNLIKEIHQ